MNTLELVSTEFNNLSRAHKEARNVSLASVLEPLSEKPGCITRKFEGHNKTLEMFQSAGVNIYPVFYALAGYVEKYDVKGIYQLFPKAVALSKFQRKGSQINTGILEFAFPIVAAHTKYDPESKLPVKDLLVNATTIVMNAHQRDFNDFIEGKNLAKRITEEAIGKTYEIPNYDDLSSIYDFYKKEFDRESNENKSLTGIRHNEQFLFGFPTILETYNNFTKAKGRISERARIAYEKVMANPEHLRIGPGLVADFIALSIYLDLSYSKDKELIE